MDTNEQEKDVLDLLPLLNRLRAKPKLLIACLVIPALVGLVVALVLPPKYDLHATLLVQLPRETGSPLNLNPKAATPLTIVEGITDTDTVVRKVATAMRMSMEDVRRNVKITTESESSQIHFESGSDDVERTTKFLNTYVASVQDSISQFRNSANSRLATLLEKEIEGKERQLKLQERLVVEYERNSKHPANPNPTTSYDSPAERLYRKTIELEATKKQLDYYMSLVKTSQPKALTQPSILPETNSLRAKLEQKEQEVSKLKITLGPDAPAVREAEESYAKLKAQAEKSLQAELSSIQQGIHPAVSDLMKNYQTLLWEVQEAKDYAEKAPVEARDLRALLREAKIQEDVLIELRKKYEEARINAQVDQILVTLIDAPSRPESPNKRRMVIYPLAGAGFGLLVALVLALRPSKVTAA